MTGCIMICLAWLHWVCVCYTPSYTNRNIVPILLNFLLATTFWCSWIMNFIFPFCCWEHDSTDLEQEQKQKATTTHEQCCVHLAAIPRQDLLSALSFCLSTQPLTSWFWKYNVVYFLCTRHLLNTFQNKIRQTHNAEDNHYSFNCPKMIFILI